MPSADAPDLFSLDRPAELDPAYVAPVETIEELMTPRRPSSGEWVNAVESRICGSGALVRGPGLTLLARVDEVREDGFVIREWKRDRMAFGEPMFVPADCVISRCSVNAYSLTGVWPSEWKVA